MGSRFAAMLVWTVAAMSASAQPAATGSVAGRVRYVGRMPEPVYVFESGQTQPVIALDQDKGVAAAVVAVDSPAPAANTAASEVTINQRNWWFTPGIIAVRARQPVRFTNDDPSNHSVRSTTGVAANRFSAYTGTGQPYVHHFRANRDGSPVVLTCDIHAWMMAWVYVFDHPHFAQTDRTGYFSLPNVAPGRYRLSVRHGPSGLSRDVHVTVVPGKEALVDVAFGTPDLRPPNR